MERYDPKTDTWTIVAPISSARDAVGVCLLGDRLYAVGGFDGQQYISAVESYDAQNNEWTKVLTFFIVLPFHPMYTYTYTHTHSKYFTVLKASMTVLY